ncbi:MAG: hypothetical protein V8R39_01450 [Clostridia bacterium]
MNICFFQGKIISKINFKFVMESDENLSRRHISICYFNILLNNKTIIKAKAYDNMADLCYRKLKIDDFININGRLCENYEVELCEVEN